MAIKLEHGSIAGALGLAQQAGKAQRNRTVAAQDLAFLDMMQRSQAQADQQYAHEIQIALGAQEANARLGLAAHGQQQDAAQNAARLGQGQQALNLDAARLQASQQNQAAAQQQAAAKSQQDAAARAAQQQFVQQQGSPDDLAYFNASGKLPETVVPQNPRASGSNLSPDYRMADLEYRRLERQIQAAQKALEAVQYDARNLDHLAAGQSPSVPGAIAGQESQFTAQAQRVQQLQAALDQQHQSLLSVSGNGADPRILAAVAQQQNGRSAPAQQPRIVAVAVNAQGQKLGFDANVGLWVPLN